MSNIQLATVGGGCFWCVEAVLLELKGVHKVVSGYSGGSIKNPTYREICSGLTGHAEVVQVSFDADIISYEDLLTVFMTTHDPTTLNRQGNDVGTQYRSVIFYRNDQEKELAEKAKADIEESEQAIADMQEQLGDLKGEMEVALDEVEAKYDALIADTKEVPVAPKKTDVRVAMFGVAWVPHYLVESGGRTLEVPAYTAE